MILDRQRNIQLIKVSSNTVFITGNYCNRQVLPEHVVLAYKAQILSSLVQNT